MASGAGADLRRAFREFVWTTHPDLGGDPEAFRAGLEAFRSVMSPGTDASARRAAAAGGRVEVHHRRRGLGLLLDWFLAVRARRRRPPRVR